MTAAGDPYGSGERFDMHQVVTPPAPVPVVRAIVQDTEGRVLVLHRAQEGSGAGLWCLPGGKVDYGESVEQAVRKELAEETGLTCLEARFLFYQDIPPLAAGLVQGVNLYFVCRAQGKVRLNEESMDYRWIGRDDLPNFAWAFCNREGLERFWPAVPSQ